MKYQVGDRVIIRCDCPRCIRYGRLNQEAVITSIWGEFKGHALLRVGSKDLTGSYRTDVLEPACPPGTQLALDLYSSPSESTEQPEEVRLV